MVHLYFFEFPFFDNFSLHLFLATLQDLLTIHACLVLLASLLLAMHLTTCTTSTGIYSLWGDNAIYSIMYWYIILYTTQNHIMIIFKLLIKLHTTVLLLSLMVNLQVLGYSFTSLHLHFKKPHGTPRYEWFPPVFNMHYNI